MKMKSTTKKALVVVLVLLALVAAFGSGYLVGKQHYRNLMNETHNAMREGLTGEVVSGGAIVLPTWEEETK